MGTNPDGKSTESGDTYLQTNAETNQDGAEGREALPMKSVAEDALKGEKE